MEEEAWPPGLQGCSGHHGRQRIHHWSSLRGSGPVSPRPTNLEEAPPLAWPGPRHAPDGEGATPAMPAIHTPPVPAPLQW